MKLNLKVIWSLAKRDLRMYFSNPSGYVFITLFIFLSAAAAFWQDGFFLSNLANLDRLNELLPHLLVLFIPALTMSVWSEERRQGTDELLLTLPATDLEIVLGKYVASLGIYTASLALASSHVLVLFWLGSPDLGLMFGNYLGYWLVGAALIAIGMLASLVSTNPTIGFIVGVLLCGGVVFLSEIASVLSEGLGRLLQPHGAVARFSDFARGVVTLEGLFYFISLAAFFIYLNVLVLSRRHWPRTADGIAMPVHHGVRAAAICLALLSVNVIAGRASARLDVTAEQLHSMSRETRGLLDELDPERPVFIQAYVSPEVPEQLVQTRANLLSILREVAAVAGARVQVIVNETEPFTDAAREAREKFGITPRRIPSLSSARAGFNDVFLGLAVTCGAGEQVIPFLDRGLPVEYELARSIRVVAKTVRKKIGVVSNDLKLFGGMDFSSFRSTPEWSVVEELKKQYEVVQVSAAEPISDELDGLLVALPSALPQEEMDNLLAKIEAGTPALLLVDPLPIVDMNLAPSERPGAGRNPFQQGQPPPTPRGDGEAMLSKLGVRWDKGRIGWDSYNPHPDLAHLPEEVVFVGAGNQAKQPFNPDNRATGSLQELVFLYPGSIEKGAEGNFEFTPLVQGGPASGHFDYPEVVQRSFFGASINPALKHRPSGNEYTLAARIRTKGTGDAKANTADTKTGEAAADAKVPAPAADQAATAADGATAKRSGIDVIVIADVDFISEQFFQIRRAAPGELNFDNITFFLNAIDTLVGDESFIELRNRRVAHRTLTRVEAQTSEFIARRAAEEKQAEEVAETALKEAQESLDRKVQEVESRADLDRQTKQIMGRNLQEAETRKLEVLKANIEAEKEAKIQRSQEGVESQIRRIQSGIRTFAVLLPPIPVFILGVWILIRRQKRERDGAAAARRLRG